MDILEFTEQVSARTSPAGPGRWADATRTTVVEAVLRLAHFAEEMPPELRSQYEQVLSEVVRSLPESTYLPVSRTLRRRLLAVAPTDIRPRLEKLVGQETATA